jgi:hypothetical protein
MHHTSYLAWVRNNGTHYTQAVKYKCWNTELVANLNHVLTPYWVSLDSEVENDLCAVSDRMQDHLESFRKAAKGILPTRPFKQIYIADTCIQMQWLPILWFKT